MHSHELTTGRTFGVTFTHGEDFFSSLTEFCRDRGVRQGYIPYFLAGFSATKLVGTCEQLENPQAPVWSHVHLTNVEAQGGGTIAYDPDQDQIKPHIHVSVGLKERSAVAYTSHLIEAKIQFLTELIIVEVVTPQMRRLTEPTLYDVPLLTYVEEPGA
jgi:predicted DNA-binding protein with PD1-like motif